MKVKVTARNTVLSLTAVNSWVSTPDRQILDEPGGPELPPRRR
jgi:hypothetical protein